METIQFFNRHYIQTDACGRIVHGFSDAFETAKKSDICINEHGSYQFRLSPDGEENPPLVDQDGVHLYFWTGTEFRKATQEEIAAEKAELEASASVPSPTDILGQQVAELALSNMQKGQMINAMGAQLAQMSLDMIALKSSSAL